jgi:Tetracyclin repressor-like, C-terminal domain
LQELQRDEEEAVQGEELQEKRGRARREAVQPEESGIQQRRGAAELPPHEQHAGNDDPRADLHAFLHDAVADLSGPKCHFIAGFLTALRTDPELADAFRASLLTDIRDRFRGPIARIVSDDDPELDFRVDAGPAILAFRVLVSDEPTDPDATARQLAALILGEQLHTLTDCCVPPR